MPSFKSVSFELPTHVLFIKSCTSPTFSLGKHKNILITGQVDCPCFNAQMFAKLLQFQFVSVGLCATYQNIKL